jgi:lysophospholipase L1-like esterase
MATKLRDGETILFIGDSITDCGCWADERPLGDGYVRMFHDMLLAREPAKDVTVVNKGISGNTILDLKGRWADDVLSLRPDWLSVKIGINDLHRALGKTPEAVSPGQFAEAYDEILARARKTLPKCRTLLVDPFYISVERAPGSWRAQVLERLPKYISVVHAMSRKYRTRLVETHAIFRRMLKHCAPDALAPEPVHPNSAGHLVIAEAVYGALSR